MSDATTARIRIIVDHEKCIGSGQCTLKAPEIFDQRDEDGLVLVLNAFPPIDHYEAVRDAAQACPTGAIELSEEQ